MTAPQIDRDPEQDAEHEAIRAKYWSRERAIRAFGYLTIATSTLMLLVVIGGTISAGTHVGPRKLMFAVGFLLAWLAVGVALAGLKRVAAVAASILMIVSTLDSALSDRPERLVLLVPAYVAFLLLLWTSAGRYVLSPQYAQTVSLTPGFRGRGFQWGWFVAPLLPLALLGAVLGYVLLSGPGDTRMSTEELKDFPVHKVRAKTASLGASLIYNPDLEPTVWYSIGIELEPIELGDDAYAPDVFGETLETELRLGGIVIPARSWTEIDGEYGPVEDQGESSVYVSSVHVPIDIKSVVIKPIKGNRFRVHLELLIDFEYAGAGYRSTTLTLDVEADYEGVGFYVPQWNEPDKVKFPDEWRIPATFDERTVAELLGRFVDLDGYRLTRDEDSYHLQPTQDR